MRKKIPKFIAKLEGMHACRDACAWSSNYTSLQKAWDECQSGDWMLWLLGRLSGPVGSASRKRLVLCSCQCARLALRYAHGDRAELAIVTAEQYALGDLSVTIDEVVAAAYAAYAAYAAAAAAYAAAYAAADASYAAYAAYAAADAAADAYARTEVLVRCASIVRAMYPRAPTLR